MILELLTTESASLQYGLGVRAWSLIFAADAFISSRDALQTIELIALKCRRGVLRVQIPRTHLRTQYSDNSRTLDPFKVGIASIPLELILSIRETIIDSALWDAEKKHTKYVEVAHEKYHGDRARGGHCLPFAHCLQRANLGQLDTLCSACASSSGPQIDYKAINILLSKYSLSLVSSTNTPLLTSPPYSPREPHPWVIALATHHGGFISRTPSFLPVHTPSLQGLITPTPKISFFAPNFMRITSSDIMRFRNLVRTWRLVVIDLSGPVAMRGPESAVGRGRSSLGPRIPGAMVDIDAMDLVQSLPTMGHCEPKWMLLNPNKHAG